MASLLPDYEYDIFISYRQKDNKGDNWVTLFVDALKTELDKTFKDDVSVYFDINPHDGILDTHDVSASLSQKLKCLIFIPVISRTYCDPGSFAWRNEFIEFVKQAADDRIGLKVTLPDNNVASRVLPVVIHDLETSDIKSCETLLEGSLRGIEFIYREPGVNRPLTRSDPEERNMNGTLYRNQINRVANAVKEIISGLKSAYQEKKNTPDSLAIAEKVPVPEKSIIVLPFKNISADPDQDYFSDGLTEEVISDLSNIPELLVISRISAMTVKGNGSTIKEIADKVNVRYVLEGSVRKSANNLKINVQLIDSVNEANVWAEKYQGKLEDIFDIQEKVAQSIADALKIRLSSRDERKIRERPIDNVFAYDCYRKAFHEIFSYNREKIGVGLNHLEQGLQIAGENALIYAGMAFAYFQLVNAGVDPENNIGNAEYYADKAFAINPDLAEANFVMALISTLTMRPELGMEHIIRAYAGKPEDPGIMLWMAHAYCLIGRMESGKKMLKKCTRIDPFNPMLNSVIGWNHFYSGRFDLAVAPLVSACKAAPESSMNLFWRALVMFYGRKEDEAYDFISHSIPEPAKDSWSHLSVFLKYVIKHEKGQMRQLLDPDFLKIHRIDPQNSYFIASFYARLGKKKRALEWLENSVEGGFMNYPFMNEFDPFLAGIASEDRMKKLMKKVRNKWEAFEIFCHPENVITGAGGSVMKY
ncbi:MAG: tetratricopeptide repeat protein [Chloroflexota bacterium]